LRDRHRRQACRPQQQQQRRRACSNHLHARGNLITEYPGIA
jgi:hypothetical protein